jgi:hypothetical protein
VLSLLHDITVLDALAKRGTDEAAVRADALLRRMQKLSDEGVNPLCAPDTVSFTSVIQAWSNSSSTKAAEKAEALLFQCRERCYTALKRALHSFLLTDMGGLAGAHFLVESCEWIKKC